MLYVVLIADTDPNDSTKTVPAPYNAANSAGSNRVATSRALVDRVKDDAEKLKAENPSALLPVDFRNHLGQWPPPRYHAGRCRIPGAAGTQGAQTVARQGPHPCRQDDPRPVSRHPRRDADQCPQAQYGT